MDRLESRIIAAARASPRDAAPTLTHAVLLESVDVLLNPVLARATAKEPGTHQAQAEVLGRSWR